MSTNDNDVNGGQNKKHENDMKALDFFKACAKRRKDMREAWGAVPDYFFRWFVEEYYTDHLHRPDGTINLNKEDLEYEVMCCVDNILVNKTVYYKNGLQLTFYKIDENFYDNLYRVELYGKYKDTNCGEFICGEYWVIADINKPSLIHIKPLYYVNDYSRADWFDLERRINSTNSTEEQYYQARRCELLEIRDKFPTLKELIQHELERAL